MTVEQQIRAELIRRAIALGDELVRLADDLGHAIAGNHISQGVELMREDIARFDAPLDKAGRPPR